MGVLFQKEDGMREAQGARGFGDGGKRRGGREEKGRRKGGEREEKGRRKGGEREE